MTARSHPIRLVLGCFALAVAIGCGSPAETTQPPSASASPTATPPVEHSTPSPHTEHTVAGADDDVELLTALYEMLGHLEASRANLERGNWVLAQAHAAHPTAEYWASIQGALATHNLASLRAPLDAYLEAARAQANDASAKNEAARTALRDAIESIVGSSPEATRVKAAALAALAEAVSAEFAEGVENGQLLNVEEYQDAWGFLQVLRAELPAVLEAAPGSASTAAAEVREDLEALTSGPLGQFYERTGTTIPDANTVGERARHLAAELREIFGLAAPAATSVDEQLTKIRSLLEEALTTYRNGDAERAYELAADAYLDGFEALEPPLLDAGHRELVTQLEMDFKAVRDAIREGRSVDEVAQLIQNVEKGLRHVEGVLE